MADFDFKQLETLVAVVEQRGFKRAADALGLAQASVSDRIAALERAVGGRLLDRLGQSVSPTAVGRRLLDHARALLAQKRTICCQLDEQLSGRAGPLVVGASTIPGECILPRVVVRLRAEAPVALVAVKIGDSLTMIERVATGDVEFAVVGTREDAPHLVYTPLWRDALVLAVPPGHPWAGRTAVTPAELAGEPLVVRESGSGTRAVLERALGCRRVRSLTIAAELGSTAAVREAVRRGLGVSVLSSRALASDVEGGHLAALTIDGLDTDRRLFAVQDGRREISPLAARFLALCADDAGRRPENKTGAPDRERPL